MIWGFLFLAALIPVIILAVYGPKKMRRVWPAGLLGVFLVYVIDSLAIKLNLYSFAGSNLTLSGIPLFYLLTAFPVSLLVYRFLPREGTRQFLYLGLIAGVYLLPEIYLTGAGYFEYINWSLLHSYILNLGALLALVYLGHLSGLEKGLDSRLPDNP